MDKLFKLLELYIYERGGQEKFVLRGGQIYLVRKNRFQNQHHYDTDCIIISKRFGFIQWLVENDKINWEEIKYSNLYIPLEKDFNKDDRLIMLLSISENPIEFLISMLK